MKPFRLHEPTDVHEAASALADAGGGAALYAGGTELLLAMKSGLLAYDTLINVKSIPGLDAVSADGDTVVIGASATHSAVECDPLVRKRMPLLAEVEHGVANLRVRNVGTLAGNLCFAEPHSDPATLLLVYEAGLDIAGPSGTRRITVGDLQTGSYETSLEPDELLIAVRVPALPAGMCAAYSKFGYHHRPTLGIAAALGVKDGVVTEARLALGCVSPVAQRLSRAEDVLRGERVDTLTEGASALREASRLASEDADAVEDMHGGVDYKEHLVRVFMERTLLRALARNGGGDG
ncbi:MAG: FAD binding domain-containing protein [Chloroflexi bacterium]|nr:FAD binding domain-containing protein [Chloroflexota bacterium]